MATGESISGCQLKKTLPFTPVLILAGIFYFFKFLFYFILSFFWGGGGGGALISTHCFLGESIIQASKSQRTPTEFGPPVISRANVVFNR